MGAPNLLEKGEGEERAVFMPPDLCPHCPSLLKVLPTYCHHLLSGRFLPFSETLLEYHLLCGSFPDQQNEWSLL